MKVALCTIAKNENLYIREWVEWYKNLGIYKIFIYDNNDFNGETFEEVINDYIESGFVEIIDARGLKDEYLVEYCGISIQQKCYISFYESVGKEYDWICYFDIDEFLTFKEGWNLESFLSQSMFDNTDTILVGEITYDDNNMIYYEDKPVMERFTHKSKHQKQWVKSIVRSTKNIPVKNIANLIHSFRLKDSNICYANGQFNLTGVDNINWYIYPRKEIDDSICVLNHYQTKTIEEYIKRHLNRHWRPDPYEDNLKRIMDIFFGFCEKTDEKLEYLKNKGFNYE